MFSGIKRPDVVTSRCYKCAPVLRFAFCWKHNRVKMLRREEAYRFLREAVRFSKDFFKNLNRQFTKNALELHFPVLKSRMLSHLVATNVPPFWGSPSVGSKIE